MPAPIDQYKDYLPKTFATSANDEFFEFAEKILYGFTGLYDSYTEALPLMSLLDSSGGWLDMIGDWCGLKRPNVAIRELGDGEVLFQDFGPVDPPFNELHSLSTDNPVNPDDVSDTFFPSILTPTEDLMDDAQYSQLLIAYQSLKFNGDTLPNVKSVLDVLLSLPYALTEYVEGEKVVFTVSESEAFNRIVSVDTLFQSISGDGIQYVVAT